MKILLSAYACEPGSGSEPAVGWNWAEQMSRFHEVWVLTRANNRKAIEASGLDWVRKVHWCYYDVPPWLSFWKRKVRGFQLYYYLWQIGVYLEALKLSKQTAFDLVHHVTVGRYWTPSWLGLLPVPFLFGPVGGGEDTPRPLLESLTERQKRYERFRNLLRELSRFDPVLRRTLRRGGVVSATEDTAEKVKAFRPKMQWVQPQLAMSREAIGVFNALKKKTGGPFRLISIGRLVHWKGYHLSIRAFAEFAKLHPDAEYWLVNSGPERAALEALARDCGCASQVKFWGRLATLGDVYEKLEQSDVLVHPALHEAFGNVCLEAMAAGRPVICFDRGGPAVQVRPDTGILVEPGTVDETVKALALAMQRLAEDAGLREKMGENGRLRVAEHFSWEKMAETMNLTYQQLCGGLVSPGC